MAARLEVIRKDDQRISLQLTNLTVPTLLFPRLTLLFRTQRALLDRDGLALAYFLIGLGGVGAGLAR
jgi:hypothetical protein